MPEKKFCAVRGCIAPADPGYDVCFFHRQMRDEGEQEEQKDRQEQIEKDFRETFGSESGRRVLSYLANAFWIFETTLFIGPDERIDPYRTLVNEGGRLLMQRILALAGRLDLKSMEELCHPKQK